jgi:predicted acyltransferase
VKILIVFILLIYWAILVIFGGDSPFTLEGNFARTFDIAVLRLNHIPVFHGVKFDQTGLLSTLPSIANVLLGYLAARIIDTSEVKFNAVKKLILYGIAGIFLAKGWDLVLPINKPLWTSSFVLYTCGFASLFLGILYWIIDLKGYVKWTKPFRIFGMNPIFIYVLSEFLAISFWITAAKSPSGVPISITAWIYNNLFMPLAGTYNGSLLYALTFTFFCWLAGLILFRKKIFIRL